MNQLDEKITELLHTIRLTPEYQKYQDAKEKLHQDPELERQVHEFRKKNHAIQNSGNVELFWEVDQLERENTAIRKNPIAEEYMEAELAFCRMVQGINWKLIAGLDFEVGFINE